MKIAIYNRPDSFAPHWVEYCQKNNIDYKLVTPYDTDIVKQIKECDAFMWHHHQANYKDCLFAKQLLFSLEQSGKVVFPNFWSGWHFDDKVGEKYLLEAIEAPMVPSYAFYTKKEAYNWIRKNNFPKVFKLRGGAGASNVKLVHTASEARKLVRKAFGNGFSQYSGWNNLTERWRKYREGKTDLKDVLKGVMRIFIKPEFAKLRSSEKGYVYFQEFIPNNTYDIRLIVINGEKAFGERRMTRKGDFRASGSGDFAYDGIDIKAVKVAFDMAKKMKLQSVAFDFVVDAQSNPLIVEMSFCFGVHGVEHCLGYWTDDLQWHEMLGFDFYGWMVEGVIDSVKNDTK